MIPIQKIFFKTSFVAKMSQIVKRQAQRAKRVQQNVENSYYSPHIEHKIRKKLTIQSSIEELQKQMYQQIARALKNSESKVIFMIKKAQQKALELQNKSKNSQEIKQYNELIDKCEKARWQFMIHRHAVGFTIKNYELVTSLYKIPSKISLNQQLNQ